MKLSKFSAVADVCMDTLSITPNFGKIMKSITFLTLTIHLLSCFWFLWKALGASVFVATYTTAYTPGDLALFTSLITTKKLSRYLYVQV
jgi:hypothetical protein